MIMKSVSERLSMQLLLAGFCPFQVDTNTYVLVFVTGAMKLDGGIGVSCSDRRLSLTGKKAIAVRQATSKQKKRPRSHHLDF